MAVTEEEEKEVEEEEMLGIFVGNRRAASRRTFFTAEVRRREVGEWAAEAAAAAVAVAAALRPSFPKGGGGEEDKDAPPATADALTASAALASGVEGPFPLTVPLLLWWGECCILPLPPMLQPSEKRRRARGEPSRDGRGEGYLDVAARGVVGGLPLLLLLLVVVVHGCGC